MAFESLHIGKRHYIAPIFVVEEMEEDVFMAGSPVAEGGNVPSGEGGESSSEPYDPFASKEFFGFDNYEDKD